MTTRYKYAEVKYNNGDGALLCHTCSAILAYGFDHEDKEHYCKSCEALNKLAEQAQELGVE